MPLHRQAAHYARLGVLLATTTLYGWVEAAARDLAPIADRLLELLIRRTKIHADDTPVTVLNPGRSGTHDGRFWVYADDTRPRGGSEPSIAVFRFSAGRSGQHPGRHLAGFTGTLQADAFSGFDHLYRGGAMVEAGCLGHARRKLVDLVRAKSLSPRRRYGMHTSRKDQRYQAHRVWLYSQVVLTAGGSGGFPPVPLETNHSVSAGIASINALRE